MDINLQPASFTVPESVWESLSKKMQNIMRKRALDSRPAVFGKEPAVEFTFTESTLNELIPLFHADANRLDEDGNRVA